MSVVGRALQVVDCIDGWRFLLASTGSSWRGRTGRARRAIFLCVMILLYGYRAEGVAFFLKGRQKGKQREEARAHI